MSIKVRLGIQVRFFISSLGFWFVLDLFYGFTIFKLLESLQEGKKVGLKNQYYYTNEIKSGKYVFKK